MSRLAATIKKLNKSFEVGDSMIQILHDINIDIRMGELTMLVGPSGCGKTTLISIISGILSPTSGEIHLIGNALSKMNDQSKVLFRRTHIGFIFQQYNLLPALTAAENAAMPLLAAGMSLQDATAKARVILDSIGMVGQTEKLPRQLSGGQQQRVAIARALVHNPELIVCDEPTAALDAKTGHAVMEILRGIANDQNRAVLIVTHDNRIYHFADRILEMSDGRIIGSHKPEEFVHKE
ncbi:ABC transporter ATP-binding protein [Candidatus Berkiella cookevillensis]|uniref:ABC transporter ATP-binding protein n=2 Tax=Candidatus Berkiella cookevillensis TaxID=437022 RepID=A0A0Q9YA32_9GAMM|nr:ABC transporter ATP-binding protein [Candidatus Berkiella cookevillensis]MCS5707373.1 ABC transporter ATP-binding protein [Candidatus Berkiella cookevillensis]